jgi:hypothetical protein
MTCRCPRRCSDALVRPVATSPSPERTGEARSASSCPASPPPPDPWELMPQPLLLLGHWLGHDNRSSHGCGDRARRTRVAPRLAGRSDRFSQWADPAGRSPCGCPATVHGRPPCPWAVALGRIGPNTVRSVKNLFTNLFNSHKIVQTSKNYRNLRECPKITK